MSEEQAPYNGFSSGLLHNMSAPSRTQVQHRSPYRRTGVRGLIFVLPRDRDVLAEVLGKQNAGGLSLSQRGDAEEELRQRINTHAATLDLPAAALVTDRAEPGEEECDNPLTVVTVLAKSSGRVYLRDKEPNLSRIKPGAHVVLLVKSDETGNAPRVRRRKRNETR